jgi:hypothetical protein
LSKEWEPWQRYWRELTPENREACRNALSPQVIRDIQYCHGANLELVSPDGYMLDIAYMARPGADEAQLDLFWIIGATWRFIRNSRNSSAIFSHPR